MVNDIPDNILDYPLVQYIPLKLYKEKEGSHRFRTTNTYITIYKENEEKELNKRLSHYNFYESNYNIEENNIVILIFNGKVDLIKYRGYEVFMIGAEKENHIHLFQVTTNYFYKYKLIFTLYNNQTGKRLRRENLELRKTL